MTVLLNKRFSLISFSSSISSLHTQPTNGPIIAAMIYLRPSYMSSLVDGTPNNTD